MIEFRDLKPGFYWAQKSEWFAPAARYLYRVLMVRVDGKYPFLGCKLVDSIGILVDSIGIVEIRNPHQLVFISRIETPKPIEVDRDTEEPA